MLSEHGVGVSLYGLRMRGDQLFDPDIPAICWFSRGWKNTLRMRGDQLFGPEIPAICWFSPRTIVVKYSGIFCEVLLDSH